MSSEENYKGPLEKKNNLTNTTRKPLKLNNFSKMLSLKNFGTSGSAGNSIIFLKALVNFYTQYISVKSRLI